MCIGGKGCSSCLGLLALWSYIGWMAARLGTMINTASIAVGESIRELLLNRMPPVFILWNQMVAKEVLFVDTQHRAEEMSLLASRLGASQCTFPLPIHPGTSFTEKFLFNFE